MLFFSNSHPSFDEIIFEHRNRRYGAFVLRKDYDRRVLVSFGLAVSLFLLLIAPVIMKSREKAIPAVPIIPPEIIRTIDVVEAKKTGTEAAIEKPLPSGSQEKPDNTLNYTPVDSLAVSTADTTSSSSNDEQQNTTAGKSTVGDDNPNGKSTGQGQGPGTPDGEANSGSYVDVADIDPEFPGGLKKLYRYLGNSLRYPDGQIASGTVYVAFVVDTKGNISNVEILKSLGPAFDAEVVRVVKKMPRWIPGKWGGKDIAVRMKLPVRFSRAGDH